MTRYQIGVEGHLHPMNRLEQKNTEISRINSRYLCEKPDPCHSNKTLNTWN